MRKSKTWDHQTAIRRRRAGSRPGQAAKLKPRDHRLLNSAIHGFAAGAARAMPVAAGTIAAARSSTESRRALGGAVSPVPSPSRQNSRRSAPAAFSATSSTSGSPTHNGQAQRNLQAVHRSSDFAIPCNASTMPRRTRINLPMLSSAGSLTPTSASLSAAASAFRKLAHGRRIPVVVIH